MLSILRITTVLFLTLCAAAAPYIRAASNGPKFVVYHDIWLQNQDSQIPDPSDLKGFNVLNLSFLMLSGATDQALVWQQLSDSERQAIKAKYAAAGISLMVSAFGSTDAPTSAGADAIKTANSMAAWVKKYDLDGIDVDYEDFDAVGANTNNAAQWLADFTSQLRKQLPEGQFFITHAPVAPWFSDADGVYRIFNQKAGSQVDWYNVQFYNQGSSEYTTCGGLFDKSSSAWPSTSVFELNSKHGLPLDKIVVGKPGVSGDAANGFINTVELAACAAEAASKGWNGGIMVWEYRPGKVDSSWISAVRAVTWPLGSILGGHSSSSSKTSSTKVSTSTATSTASAESSSVSQDDSTSTSVDSSSTSRAIVTQTTATRTSTKSRTSSTPTGAACGTASAWSPETTYWVDDTVAYNGSTYTAKWWNVGDKPTDSDEWGVWKAGAACQSKRSVVGSQAANAVLQAAAARKMVRAHKRMHH